MNDNVDFGSAAELYPGSDAKHHRQVAYRRFDTLADAVRFAIEELKPTLLLGAVVEADEVRYEATEIRSLYDSTSFPPPRTRG